MYLGKIISKVPGEVQAESNKEKQGYLGDLSQKTVPQLKDLLDRQLKLLANKSFINKLADKGSKIIILKETIEEELNKRNESEKLSKMFSGMSINGKEDLDALEWTGKCAPGHIAPENDASDDEQNPLKILATHSGAGFHKKKLIVMKPEERLIKPSDLVKDGEPDVEEYAKQLCDRLDSVISAEAKTKFLPHKSLKTEKKVTGTVRGTRWEVTAATPPPPVHGDVKLVSLQESIRLQAEQQHHLKEVQMKHAAERLAESAGCSTGLIPQAVVGTYRDPGSPDSSDDEGSEHEVHDEEYPDTGGVVIYNLIDDLDNS